jgi:hypothetical protein
MPISTFDQLEAETLLPGVKPLGTPKAFLYVSQSLDAGVKSVSTDDITVMYDAKEQMYIIDIDGVTVELPTWMIDNCPIE